MALQFTLTYDGETFLMAAVADPEWVYKGQLMPDKSWVIADPIGQHFETIQPERPGPTPSWDYPRTGAAFECVIDAINNRRGK